MNPRCRPQPEKKGLEKFSFQQKEGHLIVQGENREAGERKPNRVSDQAKNFQVGDNVIYGNLEGEGAYHIEARKDWLESNFKSKNFTFNHFSAGVLEGKVELKDGVLALSNLVWG